MSTIIQPILTPLEIDLIISLIMIVYGVVVECHYTAWYSVVMNIVMTAVFLGSNPLPLVVMIILLVYVGIGVLVAKFDVDWAYSLFGTKTFGALTLTACLYSLGFLNWVLSGFGPNTSLNIASIYIISWVIIAIIVHGLGWHYFGGNSNS